MRGGEGHVFARSSRQSHTRKARGTLYRGWFEAAASRDAHRGPAEDADGGGGVVEALLHPELPALGEEVDGVLAEHQHLSLMGRPGGGMGEKNCQELQQDSLRNWTRLCSAAHITAIRRSGWWVEPDLLLPSIGHPDSLHVDDILPDDEIPVGLKAEKERPGSTTGTGAN